MWCGSNRCEFEPRCFRIKDRETIRKRVSEWKIGPLVGQAVLKTVAGNTVGGSIPSSSAPAPVPNRCPGKAMVGIRSPGLVKIRDIFTEYQRTPPSPKLSWLELVDTLVSNTSALNGVPVRIRVGVQVMPLWSEQADTTGLNPVAVRRAGSNPAGGTRHKEGSPFGPGRSLLSCRGIHSAECSIHSSSAQDQCPCTRIGLSSWLRPSAFGRAGSNPARGTVGYADPLGADRVTVKPVSETACTGSEGVGGPVGFGNQRRGVRFPGSRQSIPNSELSSGYGILPSGGISVRTDYSVRIREAAGSNPAHLTRCKLPLHPRDSVQHLKLNRSQVHSGVRHVQVDRKLRLSGSHAGATQWRCETGCNPVVSD